MSSAMNHYLLVFDHSSGKLVSHRDFGSDQRLALSEYAVNEAYYHDKPEIEIVLIGSDSMETVKITHANYFDETVKIERSRFLADL